MASVLVYFSLAVQEKRGIQDLEPGGWISFPLDKLYLFPGNFLNNNNLVTLIDTVQDFHFSVALKISSPRRNRSAFSTQRQDLPPSSSSLTLSNDI